MFINKHDKNKLVILLERYCHDYLDYMHFGPNWSSMPCHMVPKKGFIRTTNISRIISVTTLIH